MSERRRSLFVLFIVVALIGGSIAVVADQADEARPGPPGRCPARLPGGADRAAAGRSTRTRCSGRSTSCSSASTSSASPRPSSSRPATTRSRSTSRASRTPSAPPQQVGSTAQLFFYDWEANILDEKCKTDPDQNANQRQPIVGLRTAVAAGVEVHRASASARGSDPLADDSPGGQSQAAAEPRFYVFDKTDEEAVQRRADVQLARGRAGLADRRRARERRGHRGPGRRARPARPERADRRTPDAGPLVGHPGPPGPLGHGHQEPGAELRPGRRQPADRHLQLHRQGPQGVPGDHAPGRPARRRQRARRARAADLAALRDRARQRARLGAVHQLAGEPGRHRRRDRRPDLRQLHDQVRAGPGEDPQDRRAAAEADRDLALAGLRDARQAGARPGPEGRHRGLHHRRALPDHLLPRAGRHRDGRARASTRCTSTRWSS